MKRILLSILLLLVLALPTFGQSDDLTTYEFETGTTLDYPDDWDADLQDGLLTITDGNLVTILVVDYPITFTLSEDGGEIGIHDAVETLSNILLDTSIDPDDIYDFISEGRDVAAYDFSFALSGTIFAVEFTNGAVGMLVAVEVDEDLETTMLDSFDNSDDVVNDVALPAGRNDEIQDEPRVFIFQTNQRFIIPAGWGIDVRQRDDIQYVTVNKPDSDVTVQLFDLSESVTKGTELEDVLDSVEIDWEDDFGIEIDSDAEDYAFSDREAISYEVSVDGADGTLVILRFEDDAIGMAVIFGDDANDYEAEISHLLGSFNNLGAVLGFMQ